uniref:CCHC-type domain-containing protein n=1 Tax=Tanacetum cinerariifolium TaxID=118510 RepID=A0A6L2MGE1_TANCI|nr:hypothetical protein [Tanacetum cinerariifolium]
MRKAYNTIMVEGLENTGKNLVVVVKDVYVFAGSFTYITYFVVLDDIGEFIQINKAEVVMAGVSAASETSMKKCLVTTAGTKVNAASESYYCYQPNSPQLVHEDLEQIHPDDMEEMDLRWQMAMLTMRARKFLKKTGRKLTVNGNKTIGFDKSNVKCYNCHKRRHFARECQALRNQDNKHKKNSRRSVPAKTSTSTSLVSCDGVGGYDWSDQANEGANYALMAFSSSSSNSEKNNLHRQCKLFSKGNSLTQQWEHFFTSSGKIH